MSVFPEDFFESVAAGDEFLERVFALGKHPARAVEGDVVGVVCSVEDPLGEALDLRQLQLNFVVQAGDLFFLICSLVIFIYLLVG